VKFVVINPKKRTIETVDCESLIDAQTAAGLGNVDHGMLAARIGYVVDEFGLYSSPMTQSYFGIKGRLIAGVSVLYGIDDAGENVPLMKSQVPDATFYLGVNDVEAAIARGEVARPISSFNGREFWRWPQPAPKGVIR
jgi:hypothetical protein